MKIKLQTLSEIMAFLWREKLWWLTPLLIVLVIFGILILAGQSSPLIPFLYPLF